MNEVGSLINLAAGQPINLADAFRLQGTIYELRGNPGNAKSAFREGADIAKECGDELLIAQLNEKLGDVCSIARQEHWIDAENAYKVSRAGYNTLNLFDDVKRMDDELARVKNRVHGLDRTVQTPVRQTITLQ